MAVNRNVVFDMLVQSNTECVLFLENGNIMAAYIDWDVVDGKCTGDLVVTLADGLDEAESIDLLTDDNVVMKYPDMDYRAITPEDYFNPEFLEFPDGFEPVPDDVWEDYYELRLELLAEAH